MTFGKFITGVATLAASVCLAAPPTARIGTDAAVRLDSDDARLQFVLFESFRGKTLETLNEHAERVADNSIGFRFVRSSKAVMGAGRATLRQEKDAARFNVDYTAHTDLRAESGGFILRLRCAPFAGLKWKADGQDGVFPAQPIHTTVGEGSAKSFTFDCPGKRTWTIAFPSPAQFVVNDTRRQAKDEFEIRFACGGKVRLGVGKGGGGFCTLSSSAGKVVPAARDFHGIGEGKTWVKLAPSGGVRQGSALDLSRGPTRRTPAGVDGALTATTNGQFRFARRNEAQRFFGCRVATGRLFDNKQATAAHMKDLAKFGYNSVRLKYAERQLLAAGPRGLQCDPEQVPKFDQVVTSAAREGLYSFYDILTPRPWTWGELGIPSPGGKDPEPALAAALCFCDARAFGAWKTAAGVLYGRKNKIGSKMYPMDPAVPLVSVFSDCSAFSPWEDVRAMPFLRDEYGKWLKAKRAKDPDFMKDAVCEEMDFGVMPLHEVKAASIRAFLAERETAALERMRGHLATFKTKALVGATLSSWHYRDVAVRRMDALDFSVEGFAIDPPRHMGEKWTTPWKIDNQNPLVRPDATIPGTIGWREKAGKPFLLGSWSAYAPSSWRAASGLLVGAWAGRHGWDGVWRDDEPTEDPFAAATERAVWALFARGDMPEDAPAEAFVIKDGALTVRTERTVGGFSPKADGQIVAAPLAAKLKGAKAAVWVSSLTDAPVASSKSLLLTHLTEMQREGTLFADSRADLLLREGKGAALLRDGSASIELALEKASAFRVYALTPDGLRQSKIPTEVKDGVLTFTADVRGAKGAQHLYELVRD